MDTIFVAVACYLLAISCAVMQTEKRMSNVTPTITNLDLPSPTNPTNETDFVSPIKSTAHVNDTSDLTENTTPFPSTIWNHDTSTSTTNASTESSSPPQTSQSTASMTPLTNSASLTTQKPGTHTPTLTAITTPATHSTEGVISTSDSAVITTSSSHTADTISHTPDRVTQGKKQAPCFINDSTVHSSSALNTPVSDCRLSSCVTSITTKPFGKEYYDRLRRRTWSGCYVTGWVRVPQMQT